MLTVTFGAGHAGATIVPICNGHIPKPYRAIAEADQFEGEPEGVCQAFGETGRIVLVGLGGDPVASGAAAASRLLRERRIAIDATGLTARQATGLAAGACLRAWRFDRLKSRPEDAAPRLAELDLLSDDPGTPAAWHTTSAGVQGALFARDLVSEPANRLTPAVFAERLESLAADGLQVEIRDVASLRRDGFGGVLAVGQGSVHPPCVVILRWAGTAGGAPVAFVGKGITFDTGGICIKPADRMWDMRADMAGAAACAGAMLALARRRSPMPAIAVLPLAENAIGSTSTRPGDVLRMLSGATVQIVDTDAEGRLVLADALACAAAEGASAIIDIATLTGSIVTALGHERAGLFDSDAALARAVAAAGDATGERVWRMPITEADRRALDSDIADLKHCVDDRLQPDAAHAAAFLRTFVADTPWAHIDMAGMDSREEATDRFAQGATGFGVRLLDRLVADHFELATKR